MSLLSFFTALPVIGNIVNALGNLGVKLYSAKLAAEGSHESKELELAARELRLDEVEARLNAQSKSEIRHIWWAPENLMAYIMVSYWGKVIFVDNVIGSLFGLDLSTPALHGETEVAMTMIMTFWLGKRGVENVTQIIGAAFGRR